VFKRSEYKVKKLKSIVTDDGLKVTHYQYKLKKNIKPFIKEREMEPPKVNLNIMTLIRNDAKEGL